MRELSSFYDDYGLKEYPVDDDDEEDDEDYDEDEESDGHGDEAKDS